MVFAALALNAFADELRLWVVYLCAAAIGVIDGISETALLAITPNLVTPDQLAAAGALTAITTQWGTMVGPSVGGMIIAGPGVAFCYSITCVATVIQVSPSGFAVGRRRRSSIGTRSGRCGRDFRSYAGIASSPGCS
ncbi:hypothetical protein ABN034_12290 [Actinopolymorpha sp. B11F2]|uniref:hypothetical protein n=1 Tax=Actinopolymorpha sp. B11F2 TaxID=3160862 RepID=UPI0032E3A9C6